MGFFDLKPWAQFRAYWLYVQAMNDDLNRDSIVEFEEYGALADYEELKFNEYGEAI